MKKYKKIIQKIVILNLMLMASLILGFLFVPEINSVDAETIYGAHRGASLDYEENTLNAFKKALNESKYQFIEFDIQYSKDGKIVVFHENNRFLIPKKFVSTPDLTYEELNSKFEFEIPLYEDVMKIIGGEKPINIEIKSHGDFEQDKKLVDFIIQDCKNRGIYNQIMISSPSNDVIIYLEETYPKIKTGKVYFVTRNSLVPISEVCDEVYDTPADYILLHGYNLHNYKTLLKCKPEDKTLIFWYFTDEAYIIKDERACEFWMDC